MAEYMNRFGFDRKPPLDYPSDRSARRAAYSSRGGAPADLDQVDVGRMAIGQDKLTVTPLQMAEVAATIANGGVRIKPRLTSKSSTRTGARRRAHRAART